MLLLRSKTFDTNDDFVQSVADREFTISYRQKHRSEVKISRFFNFLKGLLIQDGFVKTVQTSIGSDVDVFFLVSPTTAQDRQALDISLITA